MALKAAFQRGLTIAIMLVTACGVSSCANIESMLKPKPKLVFKPDFVDLGKIEEGEEVQTAFTLTNAGKEPLKIHEAHSSCGCTVPDLKQNELKPGESTKLDIMVDTAMKQGPVTKTVEVSSNDPDSPVVSLPIKMIVNNRHEGLTDDGRVKIFTDQKCTSCHVDKGVGLAGKDLFEADCAMCHGDDAKGAVGGALIFGDYDDAKYEKHIRDTIAFGSKTHRSMPGFLDKEGGPLIQEQIDSLVVYLKELAKEEKEKKAQPEAADKGGTGSAKSETEKKEAH